MHYAFFQSYIADFLIISVLPQWLKARVELPRRQVYHIFDLEEKESLDACDGIPTAGVHGMKYLLFSGVPSKLHKLASYNVLLSIEWIKHQLELFNHCLYQIQGGLTFKSC